jgi:hypothetical protein
LTKQITIKLNHKQFRPLLDKIQEFAGIGLTESDSDTVGKSLFFCYQSLIQKQPHRDNKTHFELLLDTVGIDRAQAMLFFLNNYSEFKKKGLNGIKKDKK